MNRPQSCHFGSGLGAWRCLGITGLVSVLILQACGGVERDSFCDATQFKPQIPVCEYQGTGCTYGSTTLELPTALGSKPINSADPDGAIATAGDQIYFTQPTLNTITWLKLSAERLVTDSSYAVVSTPSFRLKAGSVSVQPCTGFVYSDSSNRLLVKVKNGFYNNLGSSTNFKQPGPTAMDSSGTVYVVYLGDPLVSTDPGVLYRIDTSGNITSLVRDVTLRKTTSIAYGNAYNGVSDRVYLVVNRVLKYVTPSSSTPALTDLGPLLSPSAIATDAWGNLYMVENQNNLLDTYHRGHGVTKFNSSTLVTTRIAGLFPSSSGTPPATVTYTQIIGNADNETDATLSTFNYPSAISVDNQGIVYVLDRGNMAIRVLKPHS